MMDANQMGAVGGTWYNVYGSKMELYADRDTGLIIGYYTSTTGSSGTYLVLGSSQPGTAGPVAGGSGLGVSLNIGWSSVNPKDPRDPSWSCVSGLAGQMVMEDGGTSPVLNLIHQFVAPNDVDLGSGQAFRLGISSDKLVYTRNAPTGLFDEEEQHDTLPPLPGVVVGDTTWTCVEDPSITFSVTAPETTGQFKGSMVGQYSMNGVTADAFGQADWDYPADGAQYQAYSLSARVADVDGTPMLVALAGWIEPQSGLLKVLEMRSIGTTWATRYSGVRTRGLTFARS